MSNTVEVVGIEGVIERLKALGDTQSIEQSVSRACVLVERAAKQKAPKGNGDLRRSITSIVQMNGGNIEGIVFTPLEYAPYVEYGTGLFAEEGGRQDVPWCYKDDKGEWHTTSGQKPQPFMRPAMDENREMVKRILKEGLLND